MAEASHARPTSALRPSPSDSPSNPLADAPMPAQSGSCLASLSHAWGVALEARPMLRGMLEGARHCNMLRRCHRHHASHVEHRDLPSTPRRCNHIHRRALEPTTRVGPCHKAASRKGGGKSEGAPARSQATVSIDVFHAPFENVGTRLRSPSSR